MISLKRLYLSTKKKKKTLPQVIKVKRLGHKTLVPWMLSFRVTAEFLPSKRLSPLENCLTTAAAFFFFFLYEIEGLREV